MAKSTKKFKDSDADFRKICSDISARKFAPIYLLAGEEPYFIDVISEKLSSSILNETERAFNQTTVYGRDTDGATIASHCRQMPMMGGYTVIIVKEAQAMPQLEQLAAYTANPLPSTVLVICHKEKSIDKRSSLYKQCVKEGVVFESIRPRDYEIGQWLPQFIARKGLRIGMKALQMLTDHLGCDIAKISNELDKLIVSLPAGTVEITDVDIEQKVGISKDYNNFELCDAVAMQNVQRAMKIADHFARNTKDNPLLVTIMALYGKFREIFIVNYLRWLERRKGVPFPNDMELMKTLKKNNLYAIGEIKQQAARWNNSKVFNILGLLREYDGKSKGIDTGGMNDGELLKELLLKIFMQ